MINTMIGSPMHWSSLPMPVEVFPVLCILRLPELVSGIPLGIKSFIAERRPRTGRPITVFGKDNC
jgi:hypothetical protein